MVAYTSMSKSSGSLISLLTAYESKPREGDRQVISSYFSNPRSSYKSKELVTKYVANNIMGGRKYSEFNFLDKYMLKEEDFKDYKPGMGKLEKIVRTAASIIGGALGFAFFGPLGLASGAYLPWMKMPSFKFEKNNYTSKLLDAMIKENHYGSASKGIIPGILGTGAVLAGFGLYGLGGLVTLPLAYLPMQLMGNYKFKQQKKEASINALSSASVKTEKIIAGKGSKAKAEL